MGVRKGNMSRSGVMVLARVVVVAMAAAVVLGLDCYCRHDGGGGIGGNGECLGPPCGVLHCDLLFSWHMRRTNAWPLNQYTKSHLLLTTQSTKGLLNQSHEDMPARTTR